MCRHAVEMVASSMRGVGTLAAQAGKTTSRLMQQQSSGTTCRLYAGLPHATARSLYSLALSVARVVSSLYTLLCTHAHTMAVQSFSRVFLG